MNNFILLAPIIGILVKLVDNIVDKRIEITRAITIFLGILYGLLIPIIIVRVPAVAPVYIAVLIGVLMTRKIDHISHGAGIASVFFFLALFGFAQVDVRLLLLFVIASIADEKGNDLVDEKGMKGPLGHFLHYRLMLEIAVLVASWYTGMWEMFLGIFFFDIGYVLTDAATKGLKV